MKAKLRDAHSHTMHNREEVEKSEFCHCICCKNTLSVSEIEDYADEGRTAVCPHCGIDAVIGDASGIARKH